MPTLTILLLTEVKLNSSSKLSRFIQLCDFLIRWKPISQMTLKHHLLLMVRIYLNYLHDMPIIDSAILSFNKPTNQPMNQLSNQLNIYIVCSLVDWFIHKYMSVHESLLLSIIILLIMMISAFYLIVHDSCFMFSTIIQIKRFSYIWMVNRIFIIVIIIIII